jgi:hypothetical protein
MLGTMLVVFIPYIGTRLLILVGVILGSKLFTKKGFWSKVIKKWLLVNNL